MLPWWSCQCAPLAECFAQATRATTWLHPPDIGAPTPSYVFIAWPSLISGSRPGRAGPALSTDRLRIRRDLHEHAPCWRGHANRQTLVGGDTPAAIAKQTLTGDMPTVPHTLTGRDMPASTSKPSFVFQRAGGKPVNITLSRPALFIHTEVPRGLPMTNLAVSSPQSWSLLAMSPDYPRDLPGS